MPLASRRLSPRRQRRRGPRGAPRARRGSEEVTRHEQHPPKPGLGGTSGETEAERGESLAQPQRRPLRIIGAAPARPPAPWPPRGSRVGAALRSDFARRKVAGQRHWQPRARGITGLRELRLRSGTWRGVFEVGHEGLGSQKSPSVAGLGAWGTGGDSGHRCVLLYIVIIINIIIF